MGQPRFSEVIDPLEKGILECVTNLGKENNSDIFLDLDKYHDYLVSSGQLENKEPKSLYNIYVMFADEVSFDVYRERDKATSLDNIDKNAFGTCYYKFRESSVFNTSNSKYKDLTLKHELLAEQEPKKGESSLKLISELMISVLEPEDMQTPIFKYHMLFFLYWTALDH